MESKLALADSTAQPIHTALYVAGQRGGGRPGRRGAHRGSGRGRQQPFVHNGCSGRSRPDLENRRGGGNNPSSNRELPVCQICEKRGHVARSKYTEELLTRAGMAESKTAPTPMAVHPPSTSDSRLFDNPTLYRSIVGGLPYLVVTRPDIQYAVNRVSQSMHAPTEQNFQALKRILRYLKGSLRRGLLFTKGNLEFSVYSDSDWANDKDDRRSTTGYLMFLGPNLISWCTKKQTRVSRSSTEAEYRAMAAGVAEAMWLYDITDALGISAGSVPL
uniref:Reverse transcriptase Ty1/copia-type domain-containing protein n=1 Tax=Solanum lycopersicum TaxID=4081 RepID=A0A3Q7EGQ3_SOLLC